MLFRYGLKAIVLVDHALVGPLCAVNTLIGYQCPFQAIAYHFQIGGVTLMAKIGPIVLPIGLFQQVFQFYDPHLPAGQ